jgi:branched-chain amino acid transport system ATP-binding protein
MAAITLLSTQGLTRHFGGLRAVDAVDFELLEGEIHALIGPNGAGKTTFVSLLSGRVEPQAGRITFAGEDITTNPAHQRVMKGIAYTFQITSIYSNLTVFENVELAAQTGAKRRHIDKKPSSIGLRVNEALKRVGLLERRDEMAGELSYGHQRLLEVAMGLALEPRLLILDEPTQGLSDREIEDFCQLIKDISARVTVLLIEHNTPVVMKVADRITVLNAGQILATGTPSAIRANPDVQRAYLGGGNDA